jgi:hypothetical protein
VVALAGPGGACEIERNLVGGSVKSVTAYFGALVRED